MINKNNLITWSLILLTFITTIALFTHKTSELENTINSLVYSQDLILRQLEVNEKDIKSIESNVNNVDKWIIKYSKKYKVDPKLVESILIVESGKNINAKSNGGAIGIAQIKTSTAKYMGIDNINNPENNIHASVKYLAYLKTKFNDDETKVISAYNAGPNAGQANGKIPNKKYVDKVIATKKTISKK